MCSGRSQSLAGCTDSCETESDSQQVLQREQGTEGHSNLLHTECHLIFRLLHYTYTYTYTNTTLTRTRIYLWRLYSRGGAGDKRLFSQRTDAKPDLCSAKCRRTKFNQMKRYYLILFAHLFTSRSLFFFFLVCRACIRV